MELLERRAIGRVAFPSRGVLVICNTQEILHVKVKDLGPIGVGVRVDPGIPDLVGQDVVLVAETLIMYADVVRQAATEDGGWILGISARRFTGDVLQFLYDAIQMKSDMKGELS